MRWFIPVLLLTASAAMASKEEMERLKRILNSPIIQRIASELGLNLPELPDPEAIISNLMSNPDQFDVNSVLEPLASAGCLPQGIAVDASTSEILRSCVSNSSTVIRSNLPALLRGCPQYGALAVTTTTSRPTRRAGRWRNGGRRRGRRSIREKMMQRAMECSMKMTHECFVTALNLADENGINQANMDALVDSFTAPDEYKTHRKQMTQMCITDTPSELTGQRRAEYQFKCIDATKEVDCMLGVAEQVSPTAGLIARSMGGKCFDMQLEPSPRAAMAYGACMADELSGFMRDRLTATAPAAGRRRRRRDADAMKAFKMIGGLEGIEKMLGTAPPCRSSWLRRCPPPTNSTELAGKVDEAITKTEAVVGPLDEFFNGLPDRMYSAGECWFSTMDTLNTDGSVNVNNLRSVMDEFEGEQYVKDALTEIIDYCETEGYTNSAREIQECLSTSAAYACPLIKMGEELMQQQG